MLCLTRSVVGVGRSVGRDRLEHLVARQGPGRPAHEKLEKRVLLRRELGLAPAAQIGLVHDIVVQQRRGMDELDHRGKLDACVSPIAGRSGGEQQQGRAQSLPASRHDVLGDLANKHDLGIEPPADDPVNALHIFGNKG